VSTCIRYKDRQKNIAHRCSHSQQFIGLADFPIHPSSVWLCALDAPDRPTQGVRPALSMESLRSAEVTIACHSAQPLRAPSCPSEEGQACSKQQTEGASPGLTSKHSRQPSGGKPSSSSEVYDCNICFDTALEPVITMCGHLYCWPCIYRWLELRKDELPFCPICKAVISPDRMIPIYGRGQAGMDPRCASTSARRLP